MGCERVSMNVDVGVSVWNLRVWGTPELPGALETVMSLGSGYGELDRKESGGDRKERGGGRKERGWVGRRKMTVERRAPHMETSTS